MFYYFHKRKTKQMLKNSDRLSFEKFIEMSVFDEKFSLKPTKFEQKLVVLK